VRVDHGCPRRVEPRRNRLRAAGAIQICQQPEHPGGQGLKKKKKKSRRIAASAAYGTSTLWAVLLDALREQRFGFNSANVR